MTKVKSKLAVSIAFTMVLAILGGCSSIPSAEVAFEDYTGNMPSGDFGTVKYFSDHIGHKGVKVTLTILDFGDVAKITDQKDVQKVSAELVKYASLRNKTNGFKNTHYFYWHSPNVFKPGKTCKLTLFYLVPPESANENLIFVFDYPNENIMLEKPCNLFN